MEIEAVFEIQKDHFEETINLPIDQLVIMTSEMFSQHTCGFG